MNNDLNMNSPKKPFVRAFDESVDDYVYAWDEDKPMMRPDDMVCPSCNHLLPASSDPMDIPNCKNNKCDNCGYEVKMYGYSDDDLSYDRTVDDADYNDAPEYNLENELPDYEYDQPHTEEMKKSFMKLDYRTADAANVNNNYNNYNNYNDDNNNNNNNNAKNTPPIKYEHLNGATNTGVGLSGLCSFVCCFAIMLFIAYFIAYKRGEIYNSDGTVNLSLIACIFFFHQLYFGYALLDWVTKPNHGCNVTLPIK